MADIGPPDLPPGTFDRGTARSREALPSPTGGLKSFLGLAESVGRHVGMFTVVPLFLGVALLAIGGFLQITALDPSAGPDRWGCPPLLDTDNWNDAGTWETPEHHDSCLEARDEQAARSRLLFLAGGAALAVAGVSFLVWLWYRSERSLAALRARQARLEQFGPEGSARSDPPL